MLFLLRDVIRTCMQTSLKRRGNRLRRRGNPAADHPNTRVTLYTVSACADLQITQYNERLAVAKQTTRKNNPTPAVMRKPPTASVLDR